MRSRFQRLGVLICAAAILLTGAIPAAAEEAGSAREEAAGPGADTAQTENGYTQEEQEFIGTLGVLRVGYVPGRIPISFQNGSGELDGVSRRVFDRIAELSGLQFDYVELPDGPVTYDYLMDGGFDLVTSVEFNRENQNARGILISQPYLSGKKVIVGQSDLEFDSAKNLKIAVATGSQTLRKVLNQQFPNFEIVDYVNIEACFDAVDKREADLLILNQYVAEHWLARPRYENLKVIPLLGIEDELCFSAVTPIEGDEEAIARGQKIVDVLNKAIARLTEDELTGYVIEETMENPYRYSGSDFLYRYRYSIAIVGAVFLAACVLAFFIIRFYLKTSDDRAKTRARGEFLSAMSHEIRTPLNGLIGLNYLMNQNLDNREKMADYLHQSTVTARYLLTLVSDILEMSRLQGHEMTVEQKPYSLRSVIGEIETAERPRMEDKKITFCVDAEIPYPEVVGDESHVGQVLKKLTDNACKFTPEGGSVTVTVRQRLTEEQRIQNCVEVRDTGCGMSEEFQKKIFDSFTQERSTVSKGNEGTGLGLAISYLLAHMMGGDLRVSSRQGEGSCFTFEFVTDPAKPVSEYVPEAVTAESLPEDGDTAEEIPERKISVLVAEDNELNAEILVEILESEGFRVAHAEDGRKAVELFAASEPGEFDFILMDLLMPVMDGFEAARRIRRMDRPDAKYVTIYACTANAFKEDRDRAFESGMDDFITKPVDVEKLLSRLRS